MIVFVYIISVKSSRPGKIVFSVGNSHTQNKQTKIVSDIDDIIYIIIYLWMCEDTTPFHEKKNNKNTLKFKIK